MFVPCAGGAEGLLAAEIRELLGPAAEVQQARGGVAVYGDVRTAMRLNLESRIAQRVLWPLVRGPYANEHDLYDLGRRVRWHEWITARQTLRVDTSVTRSALKSLNFAALRVKDAVCDSMRMAVGARPSVDTRRPDLPLLLHLEPAEAILYVDTSGEALFKRGWRDERAGKGEAPLKETLAAALLAASGWRGRTDDGPLLDPCCGAGTIAIEAAQIACGIAPGSQRRFAFERMPLFRAEDGAWRCMAAEAAEREHAPVVQVYASDVSFRMTDFAKRNASRARVASAIEFITADALQRPAPAERGRLLVNPPYGERIGPKGSREAASAEDSDFFVRLAAHWKRQYAGWQAWLLSPDLELPGRMRLKESRRMPMWNGPLECRLFCFDMVPGSARRRDAPAQGGDAGRRK